MYSEQTRKQTRKARKLRHPEGTCPLPKTHRGEKAPHCGPCHRTLGCGPPRPPGSASTPLPGAKVPLPAPGHSPPSTPQPLPAGRAAREGAFPVSTALTRSRTCTRAAWPGRASGRAGTLQERVVREKQDWTDRSLTNSKTKATWDQVAPVLCPCFWGTELESDHRVGDSGAPWERSSWERSSWPRDPIHSDQEDPWTGQGGKADWGSAGSGTGCTSGARCVDLTSARVEVGSAV